MTDLLSLLTNPGTIIAGSLLGLMLTAVFSYSYADRRAVARRHAREQEDKLKAVELAAKAEAKKRAAEPELPLAAEEPSEGNTGRVQGVLVSSEQFTPKDNLSPVNIGPFAVFHHHKRDALIGLQLLAQRRLKEMAHQHDDPIIKWKNEISSALKNTDSDFPVLVYVDDGSEMFNAQGHTFSWERCLGGHLVKTVLPAISGDKTSYYYIGENLTDVISVEVDPRSNEIIVPEILTAAHEK